MVSGLKENRPKNTLHIPHKTKSSLQIQSVIPHIIPCKIEHDGPANVSKYFKVQELSEAGTNRSSESRTTEKNDRKKELNEYGKRSIDDLYESYFRGRKLIGRKIDLFERGYKGFILPQPPDAVTQPFSGYDDEEYEYGIQNDDNSDEDLDYQEFEATWIATKEFDKLYVWVQDTAPDMKLNPWVNAIDEWSGFAELVRSFKSRIALVCK
ncbi:ribonuclease H2 non-catalytic subunit-domain-containing protein [Kockiozyma suomiensis]|uniref:ribonuclease H2 non-catalytic subunit-domain-containing protein n=1 Tax=Kockiozyma suomiensis TaxID=1337062 RepID=UPI0033430C5C